LSPPGVSSPWDADVTNARVIYNNDDTGGR
jgi:hypothetical protein